MAREYTHEDYESKTCCKIVNIKVYSSLLSHQPALDVINRGRRISNVRPQLRGGDDDMYAPQCMPIGPYHLTISSPTIEKEKMRSVRFIQSLSDQCTEAGLRALMEKLEPIARKCYTDSAGDMTPEQFTSMLLNDGCYLLLFFMDYVSSNCAPPCDDQDPAALLAVRRNTLVRDTLFLLMNQIPLIVLQRLHEHVTGGTSSVVDCIAAPVQELLQKMLFISKKTRPAPPEPCTHLLHLVHAYFQPTVPPVPGKKTKARRLRRRPTGRWRRATEYLRYANVRFKVREFADDVASSVLDVQLGGGTLWVPRLRVDSNTWTILRNLMALEEQEHRRPVTAYCLFMSQVACTAEDVELLRRAGIVDHFLSNDEQAAQGFAELCRGVVLEVDDVERNYLRTMWHELEERCDSHAQRLMGWFRHGQNVRVAAVLAAILLACQVIQTLYAAAGR